jgi:hypothetical protein
VDEEPFARAMFETLHEGLGPLMTRALLIAAVLGLSPASGQTVTCVIANGGYHICIGPNGYRSREWENGGRLYGDDGQGNHWTTIPGRWGDTTINRRNGQR